MTDHAPHPLLAPGFASMDRARWLTVKLLESLDADQWFVRPCPGGNHAAWAAGHIAIADDGFRSSLGGGDTALPKHYTTLFDMKSEVSDDASIYPGPEELMRALVERREALKTWLCSLSESDLHAPVEGDLSKFISTRAELPSTVAFHEAFHAGQVSMARRAAGLGPLF